MMKKIILLLLILSGVIKIPTYAQTAGQYKSQITPGGTFDAVYDRFGTQYKLEDLLIKKPAKKPQKGDVLSYNTYPPSYLLCSSGYFDIYFEDGSGFELNTATHLARRAVICQLFDDLSAFITPTNPGTKVNIWIRNINNVVTYPLGSGVLGAASSFYVLPTVSNPVSGIIDGQIWKTINSGTDAYTNVASPLISTGATFYHGMMAFNMQTAWHTDLSNPTAINTNDLYTTALHEVTHMLGFASLINENGTSVFGGSHQYFSRYDLNLTDFSSAPFIVGMSACSMYDYTFNPSLLPAAPVLAPNPLGNPCPLDYTDCLLASIYAGSVNQAVYTPMCWEQGSSLSHLEDLCYLPAAYPNNEYYVMSNANGTGSTFMKRYLKPEERSVLCDIGYKVATTYGNMLYVANNYNYGGTACPGLDVAGTNDGLTTGGAYAWLTTTSGTVGLTGNDLLGNDYNADEFECLEVLDGMGSVSVTSGNAGTSITFNAGGTPGFAILRYVPWNTGTGNRGNITYIYIYIHNGVCIPTACNMVMNGDFESGSNCGEVNPPDNALINCWEPLVESPDYFVRGCTPANTDNTIPTGTGLSSPATDTWNSGMATNDAFLGLGFYGGSVEEAEQTMLSSPLLPFTPYTISFWAKSANSGGGSFQGDNKLMIRGDAGLLAPLPSGSFETTGFYLGEVNVPDDGEWHYYTVDFSHDAPFPLYNLMLGNVLTTPAPLFDKYVFIDDVSLVPATDKVRFEPPKGLCAGDMSIADLSQYVFPYMLPGSTITGTGVSYSGGIYSFTASGNGWYTIFYNYTQLNGCSASIPVRIHVQPAAYPTASVMVNFPPIPPVYCEGTPINIKASGGWRYTWYSPSDTIPDSVGATIPCDGNCDSIFVAPPAPGYWYTVIADSSGCTDTSKIFIPSIGCGGPGGPSLVRTFEMPDDVKHYTTKIVPGTNNYSVLAGTIFHSTAAGGTNNPHFLLLNNNGDIIISKEYPSAYSDERVVDIQPFTDKYKVTRWYMVVHVKGGGQSFIKVIVVNNIGTIIDQREYRDMGGRSTVPMHSTIWMDHNDRRLFICGYQTPPTGIVDYLTPKQAFITSIDINRGPTHMDAFQSYAYDWNAGWPSPFDFDIATRMTVLNDGTNNLWITGSTNGIVGKSYMGSPPPPDRSAVMNLGVDPLNGNVLWDNGFIDGYISDNDGGFSDYGIDLIQSSAGNYILGNSATPDGTGLPLQQMSQPRAHKIWWITPVDPGFNPSGNRYMFWNIHKHWAAHAVSLGGGKIVVATLIEGQYSTCIPLPQTPDPDNIQVNMVTVDLNATPPLTWTAGPNKLYMTSTGTGTVGSVNSFYNMGAEHSLIEFPPTFAALGAKNFSINAPKFMNGKLNLKVLTPTTGLSVPCGEWDCNLWPCPLNSVMGGYNTYFITIPNTSREPFLGTPPSDVQVSAPNPSKAVPYIVAGPPSCFDQAGNPSYRYANPQTPADDLSEETVIYPNPATTVITLELANDLPANTPVVVTLQDITGRAIAELYSGNITGKQEIKLPEVSTGLYFVEVISGEKVLLKEKLMIGK